MESNDSRRKRLEQRDKGRVYVEHTMDVDQRIFGPLPDAIQYLTEVLATQPAASLDMHWSGYEDCELRFAWCALETDEEFADRRARIDAAHKREIEETCRKREAERARIDAEIERLRKERP